MPGVLTFQVFNLDVDCSGTIVVVFTFPEGYSEDDDLSGEFQESVCEVTQFPCNFAGRGSGWRLVVEGVVPSDEEHYGVELILWRKEVENSSDRCTR